MAPFCSKLLPWARSVGQEFHGAFGPGAEGAVSPSANGFDITGADLQQGVVSAGQRLVLDEIHAMLPSHSETLNTLPLPRFQTDWHPGWSRPPATESKAIIAS